MTIEEIKAQYSMRDIVEQCGIDIDRAGFCICPFHAEDTASMKIYSDHFYCFGCHEHGDIFKFLEKINGWDFKTAFESLGGTRILTDAGIARIAQIRRQRKKKRERIEKAQFEYDEALLWESTWEHILDMAEPLTDEWCLCMKHKEMWGYKADMALENLLDVMEQNK